MSSEKFKQIKPDKRVRALDFKGNRPELDGKDDPPVLTGNNKDMTPSSMTQDVSKVGSKPKQIMQTKIINIQSKDKDNPSLPPLSSHYETDDALLNNFTEDEDK